MTRKTPRETSRVPTDLAAVLTAALLYCSLHAGFRLIASGNLGEDDPLESLRVQQLLMIYAPPQPPLYDWVLWLIQRALGPGVAGFLLIKYAALTATAGFLYVTALRILKDRVWALLVVESMALIYQIAWRYHEGFTHEIGAMVAVAATLWAFERVIAQTQLRDFIWLGVIVGLGLMTELTYAMFLATLALAALLQPALRTRLIDRRLFASAALALLVASPYALALLQSPGPLQFVTRHSTSALVNLGKGLLDALRGPLFYLSPLIVLLPLFIPGFLRVATADIVAAFTAPNARDSANLPRLVLTQALFGVALCIAGAVLLGASGYAMHRLMPLYLSSVIWLMDVARRASPTAAPRRRLVAFAAFVAVAALSARLTNMFVLDPVCKICRWGIPYTGLAAEMQARGFDGAGLIVAAGTELAGNLRAQFPHALVTTAAVPQRPAFGRGRMAIVWGNETAAEVESLVSAADARIPIDLSRATAADIPWHHLWRPTGYRTSTWHVLVIDTPGKG